MEIFSENWSISAERHFYNSLQTSQRRTHVNFHFLTTRQSKQESRAVARNQHDAAAVLFGLKFADNIHYKFNQVSKARLQSSKNTGAKRKIAIQGHSRSRVLKLVERR